MTTRGITEDVVELAALDWFEALGYPPDQCEAATHTVLQQAELIAGLEESV